MKQSKLHKSLNNRREQRKDKIIPFRENLWGQYVADGMKGTFENFCRKQLINK
jgi:hypothetical protein